MSGAVKDALALAAILAALAMGLSATVKDALTLAAILAALALGLRLDLALDPCAADIDARPVTCPQ